ncbi:unnamed protein product [Musa textilis]
MRPQHRALQEGRRAVEVQSQHRRDGVQLCGMAAGRRLGEQDHKHHLRVLYALLNDKVLLLDLPHDMGDLFCEPFPDTSWVLPADFPIDNRNWIFEKDPHSYGNMLKSEVLSNDMDTTDASSLPAYLYLHLLHANDEFDKMFYCEEGQRLLRKFPWLLLRSNEYFVPAFFFIPEFEEELGLLFPEKATVFRHLGRYLFNPSNSVWGYITRYYDAYLASAKEKLGIQIRIFAFANVEFDVMASQIINCSMTQKLLPEVDLKDSAPPVIAGAQPKAVLVTSLLDGYFEKLRNMYYEHATTTGEVIGVYQPSHEEHQHTEKLSHNMKAFAEIYLLSLSDELITSPFSTFGYVAHGLGGLRPWILVRPDNRNPSCVRSTSAEPCFHFPPSYDCSVIKKREGKLTKDRWFLLRHCEDFFSLVLRSQIRREDSSDTPVTIKCSSSRLGRWLPRRWGTASRKHLAHMDRESGRYKREGILPRMTRQNAAAPSPGMVFANWRRLYKRSFSHPPFDAWIDEVKIILAEVRGTWGEHMGGPFPHQRPEDISSWNRLFHQMGGSPEPGDHHDQGSAVRMEEYCNRFDLPNVIITDNGTTVFDCREGQRLLRKFPWLLLRSNEYFCSGILLHPGVRRRTRSALSREGHRLPPFGKVSLQSIELGLGLHNKVLRRLPC